MGTFGSEGSSDTEGDSGGEWVPLAEAAARTGCAESWLTERCRDGRLPSRPAAGGGVLVPLATVDDLASGRISE